MSSYMWDISNLGVTESTPTPVHSTSRKKDNTSLDMTDFLNLMIVQLQNQSIDDTMDTSEMLNQMVQMQMITALANMTDASVMGYASSLVGKEVTVGVYDGSQVVEKVVTITGTGLSNGEQVIFAGDDVYSLSSIMAVGRLPKVPDAEGTEKPGDSTVTPPTDGAEKPPENEGDSGADIPPVTDPEETPDTQPDPGETADPAAGAEANS